MRAKADVQILEPRQLLTYTTLLSDPSMGMSNCTAKTEVQYDEQIPIPQIAADGTITVTGTSKDDVITVDRVYEPLSDEKDGEMDFAVYWDDKFGKIWTSGELTEFVGTEWLASEAHERDLYLANGQPDRAQEYQDRIDQATNFTNDFKSGKFIRITLKGVYDYFYEITDEQAANSRIIVNGGAGKDDINIATNVALKATLNGDAGSDTLTSGKKLARLNGGGGNDRLISRSRKGGQLDGGKGADRYYNRADAAAINVLARADGDRLATTNGYVAIRASGVFGTKPVDPASSKKPEVYYLIEGDTDVLR